MSDPVEYRLTLRPQPSDVPAIHRLRSLLKYALRVQGLKCVSAEEVPPAAPAAADPLDEALAGRRDV